MSWETWLISISIGIVALAFVALVIFLIRTLISLCSVMHDLENKVHAFDPLFRVVNKAGDAIEKRATKVKQLSEEVEDELCCERREMKKDNTVNTAMEVAEWALIGLALWQKIRERRR